MRHFDQHGLKNPRISDVSQLQPKHGYSLLIDLKRWALQWAAFGLPCSPHKAALVDAWQQVANRHPNTAIPFDQQGIAWLHFLLHGIAASWHSMQGAGISAKGAV
jgi:hypothetical protein